MSIWKGSRSATMVKKPWGEVECHNSPFSMGAKIIRIKADHRTSLKYYKNNCQMIVLYEGRVMVYAPDEKEFGDKKTSKGNYFELTPGDTLLVQPENPYRIKALEDSVLFEVLGGSPSSCDESQVVMLEDDYGRAPSTKNTEIIE